MASDLVINGSVYNGNPNSGTLFRPTSIQETIEKVGTVIVAESGARTLVQRAVKRVWTIRWEAVPESTRAALAALAALSTTFAFVDEHGTSYTAQIEPGDHQCETAFSSVTNVYYYNIDLTMREA